MNKMFSMGNPARELGEIIDEWAGEEITSTLDSVQMRGNGENLQDPALWKNFSDAARCMAGIEDFLEVNPELRERQLPIVVDLWLHIAQPLKRWDSSSNSSASFGGRTLLDSRTRAGLETLAFAIDMRTGSLPVTELTPEQLDTMRISLEKISEKLRSISEIPADIRNHLLYLLTRCLNILDGENVDLEALRSLTFEFNGALFAVADLVPEEKRKELLNDAWTAVRTWFADGLRDLPAALISGGIVGLITGG